MKKSFFIFNALLLTLSTMPGFVFAMTVTGEVKDKDGPIPGASIKMYIGSELVKINNQDGTVTNNEGKFTIKDVPEQGASIEINAQPYKILRVPATPNIDVDFSNMEERSSEMKEFVSEAKICTSTKLSELFATDGKAKTIDTEHAVCVPTDCILGYELKNDKCEKIICDTNEGLEFNGNTNQCDKTKCSKSEIDNLKKQDKNVDTGKWEGGKCVPVCKNKHHLDGGKCVKNQCENDEEDWNGTECVKVRCSKSDLETLKAKEGKWDGKTCTPTKCADEKNFKLDKGSCIANDCPAKELEKLNATAGTMQDGKCIPSACIDDYKLDTTTHTCTNQKALEEKQKAYDKAKATEQSLANRTLTAATTAATGIGGMQLAQGLAEKSADKAAEQDMAAYIATMRCTYADGKSVKFGTEEIELPGANNAELMKLRNEYFALASDLKERKTALGMKPGIESEEILDRATSGLYDDEFVGIDGGNYASLYRATALNSESDQKQIADEQKKSKNRVIAGGVLAGAGVAGGILGNSLINGKLGEKIKEKKEKKKLKTQYAIDSKETIKTLSDKALEKYNQQYGNQD